MSDSLLKTTIHNEVVRLRDAGRSSIPDLLKSYGLLLTQIDAHEPIPGSYWGDAEAGLVDNQILVRADTPLHSILHETCHYVCMDQDRRRGIHTDAGGDYDEENAVCYLQILLADEIEGFGRRRMFADMDHWRYTFRLGSARAWFEQDADDALTSLQRHGLIDAAGKVTWKLRDS